MTRGSRHECISGERRLVIKESQLWIVCVECMVSGILIGFGFALYLGWVWGVL